MQIEVLMTMSVFFLSPTFFGCVSPHDKNYF